MPDFKLLILPISEDRLENTIKTIGNLLMEEDRSEDVVYLIDILLDYFASYPYSESIELNKAECKLAECKFWLEQFYSIEDSSTDED